MKPFNPLLGETFELVTPDFKIIAEQVSHHPPVTAICADSEKWRYDFESDVRIIFNGTFIKAVPIGVQVVRLKTRNEVYNIYRPNAYVNNVLFGQMYTEQVGPMKIVNVTTGAYVEVTFKAEGWGGKHKHEFSGYLYPNEEAQRKKDHSNTFFVFGKYSKFTAAWRTDAQGDHGDHL